MDNLSNEEHELLLLMSEHAIAPPLSPEVQAMLDAATEGFWKSSSFNSEGNASAAAIRAAADRVTPSGGSRRSNEIRAELLAIADEIEGL